MSRSSTGLLSGLQIYGMLTLATYSANQGANMIIDGLIDGNKVHGFHHLLSKYYSYRCHSQISDVPQTCKHCLTRPQHFTLRVRSCLLHLSTTS